MKLEMTEVFGIGTHKSLADLTEVGSLCWKKHLLVVVEHKLLHQDVKVLLVSGFEKFETVAKDLLFPILEAHRRWLQQFFS